ncbi:hypothetical protein [Leuconostoc citreum]|uniref:hypothetical protein n=1 Tax=Leuconostoc citreum TaxID=33964 RepID=UPI0032DE75C5
MYDGKISPFILQRAQDLGFKNVRVQIVKKLDEATLPDAHNVLNKQLGYDVLIHDKNELPTDEMKRILKFAKDTALLVDKNGIIDIKKLAIYASVKSGSQN